LLLFAFLGALKFDRFVGIFFLAQRRLALHPTDSLIVAADDTTADFLLAASVPADSSPFFYSTILTRWGIFLIMPRTDGVSSRSTT
jgi:hypothetical protein